MRRVQGTSDSYPVEREIRAVGGAQQLDRRRRVLEGSLRVFADLKRYSFLATFLLRNSYEGRGCC